MSYRDRGGYRGDDRGFYRERPQKRVSIMVRNLPKSISPEDLKYYAEKYGPVKDVYLPKDYYSGDPRGLGFIEFLDERDAADAVRSLDRMMLGGREISANYAMQGRKRPEDFRRGGGGGGYGGRDRGYGGGYGGRDRGHDRGYDRDRDYDRGRDRDREYDREDRGRSRSHSRSRSRSRSRSASPARRERSRSRSASPDRRSRSRSASPPKRDRSASPRRDDASPDRARSPEY